MPKVITKKSTVVGKVPVPTDLDIGELAVNTADKKLYTKHSNNAVVQIGTTITVSSTAPAAVLICRQSKLSATLF